jgi:hypothetical protein
MFQVVVWKSGSPIKIKQLAEITNFIGTPLKVQKPLLYLLEGGIGTRPGAKSRHSAMLFVHPIVGMLPEGVLVPVLKYLLPNTAPHLLLKA